MSKKTSAKELIEKMKSMKEKVTCKIEDMEARMNNGFKEIREQVDSNGKQIEILRNELTRRKPAKS